MKRGRRMNKQRVARQNRSKDRRRQKGVGKKPLTHILRKQP